MGYFLSIEHDMLAIALYGQLLKVGREAFQVLVVRQDRHGLGAKTFAVPDG